MIEDSLYEYLQISIVQSYKTMNKSTEETQQSLDFLGFRVGYNLIERYFDYIFKFKTLVLTLKNK